MSLASAAPAAPARVGTPVDLRRKSLSGQRRFTDAAMMSLIALGFLLAVGVLALVVGYVIFRGAKMISWTFLTDNRIENQLTVVGHGIGPAIAGTLLMTGVATLIAVPLGVLGAIYLNEYGKQSALARFIRTMADVMSGVPSIIMGLFLYVTLVTITHKTSGWAGALALACMMLPIVIRSTEEMLKLVPDELRQASLALGARRWRTTVTVVLPAALSGMVSGVLLAIARAAGETAPIFLVIGGTTRLHWSLSDKQVALPSLIFSNASSVYQPAQDRAWGAALTLIAIVLITTLVARLFAARYAIKER
jgi:phosphate transport system permease protein